MDKSLAAISTARDTPDDSARNRRQFVEQAFVAGLESNQLGLVIGTRRQRLGGV